MQESALCMMPFQSKAFAHKVRSCRRRASTLPEGLQQQLIEALIVAATKFVQSQRQ